MSRDDLRALTADQLARLANRGLVNRAAADLDAGRGPTVEEADGTLTGVFPDGARAVIGRDAARPLGTCTCGASMCRHRVGTVLAYQRAAPAAAEAEAWDPGAVTDEVLRAACPEDAFRRAEALLRGSCVVTTEPGTVPVARLPTCTVQFMVPRELAFARCDCARTTGCEHVVLAVWAFRARPDGGVAELGAASGASPSVLDAVEAALVAWVTRGVAEHGPELATARIAAERAGYVWLADGLEALERQREWYADRSARFDAAACAYGVGELAARIRTAARRGELPPAFVLGASEAREAVVDTMRWLGLGARLDADGDRRSVEVFLADPLDGEVLVVLKDWTFPEAAPNGPALGEKYASSRMSLSALAGQEVVVRGARRRANGVVDLGTARSMKPTVYAGPPRWGELPEPLRVPDLAAHARRIAEMPPSVLGPRRLGGRIRVLAVEAVDDAGYVAADQEAVAVVRDAAGARARVRTTWRTVAPGAPSALLSAVDEGLRFVAGELRQRTDGWDLAAVGLATDARQITPDLAPERPIRTAPAAALPEEPVAALVRSAADLVERAAHQGLRAIDPGPVARRLEEGGMRRLAAAVRGAVDPRGLLDLAVVMAVAGDR